VLEELSHLKVIFATLPPVKGRHPALSRAGQQLRHLERHFIIRLN